MISTVDPDDHKTWDEVADEWKDPASGLNALRLYTPLRISFLKDHLRRAHIKPSTPLSGLVTKPLKGFRILEVGCGGGYVSEALAEQGATVVAIDCNSSVILANQSRQLKDNNLDQVQNCLYLKSTPEELVRDKDLANQAIQGSIVGRIWSCITSLGQSEVAAAVIPRDGYDVVVASEVLEHVKAPRYFLKCLDDLLKPEGLLMITTPNRTWLSRFTLITMAEKVLKMVPMGVHSYDKFVRHDELAYVLNAAKCETQGRTCCSRKGVHWPWLTVRRWLNLHPLSSRSPLKVSKEDSTELRTRYRHLGTQGVFFVPKANVWTKVPLKSVAYMATFKKLAVPDDCSVVQKRSIREEL